MSVRVNVLMSWFAHAVTLCVGFFLMPYILHTVGDTTYGTWLLLNSVAGQTGLLYLGFGDAISRFTSKYYAEKRWIQLNRTVSCITSVYFASGMLALGIGCLAAWAAPWVHDWPGHTLSEIRWGILILGLNAAISIAGSAFGGVLMGIQRFDIERSIIITITLLRLGLTLVFLGAEHGLITLACVFLAVTALENLLTCIMAFRLIPHLQLRFRHLRRETYRTCFGFSVFSFLSQIAEHTIYMVDTLVIGFLLGPKAVVPYYIAARLCEMVRLPVLQVGNVLLPRAGQLQALGQSSALKTLVCRGMGFAFLLTSAAFVGAACFAGLMIQVWIGDGYAISYGLLLLLMGGQLVALPTQLLRNVLTGTGTVRLPALLFAAEAAINLTLSLLLLPWLGLWGVALGTFIPIVLIETGLLLPLGMNILGLKWRELWQTAICPQLMPLSLVAIYALSVRQLSLSANWPTVIAILVGALATLVLGVWLNRREEQRHNNDADANLLESMVT